MLSIPSRQGFFAYLLILFLAFSSVDNITATTATIVAEATTTPTTTTEEKERKSISFGTKLSLTIDKVSSSSMEDEIVSNNDTDSSLDLDLDADNNYGNNVNFNETLATTRTISDVIENQNEQQFTTFEDIVCSSSMSDQFSMLCNLLKQTNDLGRSINGESDDTISSRLSVSSAIDIDWKINYNDPFTLFAPVNTAFDGQSLEILLPVGLSIADFLSTHIVNSAISPNELRRNCYANIPTRFAGETTTTLCTFDGRNTPIYQVGEGNLFSDRPQFIGTGIKINGYNGSQSGTGTSTGTSSQSGTGDSTGTGTSTGTNSQSVTEDPIDIEGALVEKSLEESLPSLQPSDGPSLQPSDGPSLRPSDGPSLQPSDGPSLRPIDSGAFTIDIEDALVKKSLEESSSSLQPSDGPSLRPSDGPSLQPSDGPSLRPPSGKRQPSLRTR
ncbi:hypothetical protein FRACYDRAFT_235550 [Fragilariopsis cylindrus CCMP1102]|uniref:FAS1 domain-containing protein n=1 Tax=Fragilariopsis cylindrus CCMP1102 TaxID=635003 RepID=A0A1E7FNX4_9STRA|nr:hypothetical protein FRACYDRAFT_235550 [Fragilariopsis cylindrus CCMP1102]|eukprot:OEU19493.1 hypothetical protein FRACYDRAFT_235550 [Fragilariopsis cylindrus CCMP1102]